VKIYSKTKKKKIQIDWRRIKSKNSGCAYQKRRGGKKEKGVGHLYP